MTPEQQAIAEQALAEAVSSVHFARELATKVGVTKQAISFWKVVPLARVLAVEAATGVPRSRLRPDFYPPEREADNRAQRHPDD